MNKFRIGLAGFCSVLVVFILVNAVFGSVGGNVVENHSVEKSEEHFFPMMPPAIPHRGNDVGLFSLYNETESIELAGKIVEFEIVQPETGLKLQKVVVNPQWTGVYLIYSDKPLENIGHSGRSVRFDFDKVVIGSNVIVVTETFENINTSFIEESGNGKFRINGNPASGRGAGKTEMYRIDLEGKKHYSEGPYQAGRVDWYVVINSNQSIRYSIAGDHSLEELKKIAGTMKKPGWVLVKPKPLPTPPPKSEPVVEGETIQMES